eukprot:Anaeramoba_ignava/a96272_119.p1 GENE.a96272_119~~a96272_119.p1  ORF type:complete len:400 (+),score=103.73 a96272_119:170-1369(+)
MLPHEIVEDEILQYKSKKFWDSQPVQKLTEKRPEKAQALIEQKVEEIRKKSLPLPEGFEWFLIDLKDEKIMDELYQLLSGHYVEDNDSMFRFNYSPEFLRWALLVPNYEPDWHLGVRVIESKKIVGFISGTPINLKIFDKDMRIAEVNFLCAHKSLRSKGLGPILIKEITRRINLKGIFQAVYTAGRLLPSPVATATYYHRIINNEKLLDVGFTQLDEDTTLEKMKRLNKIPEKLACSNLKKIEKANIPSACKLLNDYLAKKTISVQFDEAEFEWLFVSRDNVVYTYVIENEKNHQVTDLLSFYILDSTVINHPKHSSFKAAYAFYVVPNTIDINILMLDALVLGQSLGCDVFNCLNIMDNDDFIHNLRFGLGDGHLHYYLYNWASPEILPKEIGLTML